MSSVFFCPDDGRWLRFEGVQVELVEQGRRQAVWIRWDACDFCRTWYLRKGSGEVFQKTKIEPSKSAFKTERDDSNRKG